MSKIDTEENRFHALKFALQFYHAGGATYDHVLVVADAFADFLDGEKHSADAGVSEEEVSELLTQVSPIDTPFRGDDTELSDLTESYPADEPEPPVAVVDSWAAADHAISDIALVSELFEEGPHEPQVFVSDDHAESLGLSPAETTDWLAEQPAPEAEPTFEYVAAAVEQIASPPPPAPDATDEPELTDEQVERIEERLATQDPITAAEADPERELETVSAYVNVHPRTKWPWMGS